MWRSVRRPVAEVMDDSSPRRKPPTLPPAKRGEPGAKSEKGELTASLNARVGKLKEKLHV